MKRSKQTALLKLIGNVATLAILACIGVWSVAAAQPARAVVDQLDNQLLATMKNADELGFTGRYRKLAPTIDETFDIPRIAELALGSEWGTLNAAQQQAYVAKFRKDTIATYATRFDGYDGEKFEVTGAHDAAGGRRQINTDIIGSDGKRTSINYILTHDGGNWRIINVVAQGVSDLALKRGQYTTSIRNNGAEGFLKQFDKQLAKYPELPNGD